jgi:hypothetical protein
MAVSETVMRLIGPPEADGEYVVLHEAGAREEVVHLHDYERIYGVPGLYEHIVQQLLQCRSPQTAARGLARALDQLALDPAEIVLLDLGAGTGIVGELAKGLEVGTVIGVDALGAARAACTATISSGISRRRRPSCSRVCAVINPRRSSRPAPSAARTRHRRRSSTRSHSFQTALPSCSQSTSGGCRPTAQAGSDLPCPNWSLQAGCVCWIRRAFSTACRPLATRSTTSSSSLPPKAPTRPLSTVIKVAGCSRTDSTSDLDLHVQLSPSIRHASRPAREASH